MVNPLIDETILYTLCFVVDQILIAQDEYDLRLYDAKISRGIQELGRLSKS